MDAQPPYSDDSEGFDQLSGPPPRSLSPSGSSSRTPDDDSQRYSSQDNGRMTMHDGPRRSHREKGRHSANKEFMKLLASEELEARQTRKFLRSALARLDNETLRAQEAERRALELAERFKVVNDARIAAQGELTRVSEELRLYKVQYDNAQREILRGQEILKDIEAQRDDAEAAAARARTTARKLKEQQLMMRAREEGRKAGYEEGLRRGLAQARANGPRQETEDNAGEGAPNDGEVSIPDDGTIGSRADTLDNIPVRNFSPAPSVALESPYPTRRMVPRPILQPSLPPNPAGPQASRFHEVISPTPTNATLPMRPISVPNAPPSPRHPDVAIPPDGWVPELDEDNRIRLPPPHEMQRPPTPASPSPLPVPPPNNLRGPDRPPSVARDYAYVKPSTPSLAESIPTSLSTTMSQFDLVNSPRQTQRNFSGGDRRAALSVIHEVSSAADFTPRHSPSTENRMFDSRSPPNSTGMPEPLVFPGVPQIVTTAEDPPDSTYSPQTHIDRQRLADELRRGDAPTPEEWDRRNPEIRSNPSMGSMHRNRPQYLTTPTPLANPPPQPDLLRPSSSVGSVRGATPRRSPSAMSHRSNLSNFSINPPSSSGQEYTIDVIPPSGPSSASRSPPEQMRGMLSPMTSEVELPAPEPVIPTVPNSPSMGRFPSMGSMSRAPAGGPIKQVQSLPPGFIPSAPPTPVPSNPVPVMIPPPMQSSPRSAPMNIYTTPAAVPEVQRSASSSSTAPSNYPKGIHNRSRSAGQPSLESLTARSKTPIIRPPSSSSGGASLYQAAPITAGVTYPAPPVGPPNAVPSRVGTASPLSTTSRISGHTRSRSMYAGSTPAPASRPLSTAPAPKLRRMDSMSSVDSATSGLSKASRQSYAHFEPQQYRDPAFFLVPDDAAFSPNTQANTRANANRASLSGQAPGSRNSPALSYMSLKG